MSIYPYVDMTRANANGSYPVYIIVKNTDGRFFLNTGMTTCDRIDGREFPKADKNRKIKSTLLGKYLSDIEGICMQQSFSSVSNKELKTIIQREVFGVVQRKKTLHLKDYILSFAETKRESTRTLYEITARKVEAFDRQSSLDDINGEWLESFRQWCLSNGMKINGAGKELRNIRAVFNWARRNNATQNYPFLDYSIVEEETEPNNITVEQLRTLRDYSCEPWQEKYRDFFMLSFYLAGMNPVDLLTCKADAVKDGHLSFIRQKTNKQGQKKIHIITLPIIKEAREILKRYKSEEGWLLSFMDGRKDYHSFLKKANEALQKIGLSERVPDKVGKLRKVVYHPILPNITMYSARYTFGSIAANDLDISERTIGMCLGHTWSKNVTSRYMANDQKKVDNAVKRVVDFVAHE